LLAELKLPAIIGDHMVLQQKQANPVWGWDTPGTKVVVTFAGQSYSATAGYLRTRLLRPSRFPAHPSVKSRMC
jgi:hypothetical protein